MEFSASYFHTTFATSDFAPAADKKTGRQSLFAPCREVGAMPSPPPRGLLYVPEDDAAEQHHFLEECSLCGKPLAGDIFMYRGDTPFCSEECRQQQINTDTAKHRSKKQAAAVRAAAAASARKEHRQPQEKQSSQRIPIWA